MDDMATEIEFWQSQVKQFSTQRLETESKSMAFVQRSMQKFMPFQMPYLDAINEELKERYKVLPTKLNNG